jgi:hypothetical protein
VRLTRPRGDDGAMAVFVCLILVIVLLPATALALSAYTRSAVQAEKVRAADSGALAGAAALVLLDVSEVPTNPFDAFSQDGIAFNKATTACEKAAAVDDELSEDFATPVSCVAGFSPDTSLGGCLSNLLDVLPAPIPTTVVVPPIIDVPDDPLDPLGLGGGPGSGGLPVDDNGVVEDLLEQGLQIDLRNTVNKLTPALLHNGIRVTLTYRVRGPLDGLLGTSTETTRTAVSTARRRFKPLLPPGFSIATATIDPEEFGVYSTLGTTLQTLERAVGEGLTDLPVPLPPPLADPAGLLPAGCRQAVLEIIQDLRDALKTNPEEQDLLTCVGDKVLNIDVFAPLNDDDLCLSKVFRAQLAPNA